MSYMTKRNLISLNTIPEKKGRLANLFKKPGSRRHGPGTVKLPDGNALANATAEFVSTTVLVSRTDLV
jgi:hypothetical protein